MRGGFRWADGSAPFSAESLRRAEAYHGDAPGSWGVRVVGVAGRGAAWAHGDDEYGASTGSGEGEEEAAAAEEEEEEEEAVEEEAAVLAEGEDSAKKKTEVDGGEEETICEAGFFPYEY